MLYHLDHSHVYIFLLNNLSYLLVGKEGPSMEKLKLSQEVTV